ncbi:MAG: hypothetical protein JW863_11180 [Chitinispirillaceae bacterium]|nr:hypothetical protein [Chitinispirillaceae bacterium]
MPGEVTRVDDGMFTIRGSLEKCFFNSAVRHRVLQHLEYGFFLAAGILILSANMVFPVTFDASEKISPLYQPNLSGTCLPVWNNTATYRAIKNGLVLSRYAVLRFPNGTLSNEYHWNGRGTADSTGIWHPDSTSDSTGFLSTNLYCGTTSSNWGTERYSRVVDGDTASFWWSDPLITTKDPYVYLSWTANKTIDSVVIFWGERFSRSYEVQVWEGTVSYPGPHGMSESQWITVHTDTAGEGGVSTVTFEAVSTRALRVISREGFDGSDVQIREIYAFGDGTQVSVNDTLYSKQTWTYALSTHPGMIPLRSYTWNFATFMNYCDTLGYPAIPVICVNYGTGTPEEAAAWVHYANIVKKHGIRYWQIGNEMDGTWEIGGPVSAFTYAEKYIRYAKAMKAVDPDIKLLGPVASGLSNLSGEYDGRTWLEAVLFKIGEAEKEDEVTYLDGIDFHSYPYWTSSKINIQNMLLSSDYVYDESDSMLAWIDRYLYNPDSTMVMMSEFNASVMMSSTLKQAVNGIVNANLNAGLAYKFGYRAMSVIWDSFEAGGVGADNTHGSLSLFNDFPTTLKASMKYPPSSVFWGNFMVTNVWLDPDGENSLIAVDSTRSGDLRYYGNATGSDVRILVLNLSATDTLDVEVTMEGAEYDNVEVYSWGEPQFNLIGTDDKAYAMPNCGPVSSVTTVEKLGTPQIPPKTAMVLRYFTDDSGSTVPEELFWATLNSRSRAGDTVGISLSYRVPAGTITSIAWRLDSTQFQEVEALDGAFDGSYEAAYLTIPAEELPSGPNHLIVRVESDAGDTCETSMVVTGVSVITRPADRPGAAMLSITELPAGGVRINYLPERNGTAFIRLYNLSGAVLDERTSVSDGGPVSFIWNGTTVSSGVYLVKAGMEGSPKRISRMFRVVR